MPHSQLEDPCSLKQPVHLLLPRVEKSNTRRYNYEVKGRKFNVDVQGKFLFKHLWGPETHCLG